MKKNEQDMNNTLKVSIKTVGWFISKVIATAD